MLRLLRHLAAPDVKNRQNLPRVNAFPKINFLFAFTFAVDTVSRRVLFQNYVAPAISRVAGAVAGLRIRLDASGNHPTHPGRWKRRQAIHLPFLFWRARYPSGRATLGSAVLLGPAASLIASSSFKSEQ